MCGALLGQGGEGRVWDLPYMSGCVAKIYVRPPTFSPGEWLKLQASRQSKIEAMLARPPSTVSTLVQGRRLPLMAWPTHMVLHPGGDFAGFLMPKADFTQAVSLLVYLKTSQRSSPLSEADRSLPRKLELCRNLAGVMSDLHRQRHYVVDFKPQNILVFHDTAIPCIVDVDGFSIAVGDDRRVPARMVTPEYASPELNRGDVLPDGVIDDLTDRFSLALLIFCVLNGGIHPFQGISSVERLHNSNADGIRDGLYAYGVEPHPTMRPILASRHAGFPAPLRALFDRAFLGRSVERPSAREWRDALAALRQQPEHFRRCTRAPTNVMHIHFSGAPCPECVLTLLDTQPIPVATATPPSRSGPRVTAAAAAAAPAAPRPTWPASRGKRVAQAVALLAMLLLGFALLGPWPVLKPVRDSLMSGGAVVAPPAAPAAEPDPAQAARAMARPDDDAGAAARQRVLASLAEEAYQRNAGTLLPALRELARDPARGADGTALMREAVAVDRLADWHRFVPDARAANDGARSGFRRDLPQALAAQRLAHAWSPLDREVAGNLGYYLALQGDNRAAIAMASYALALPRAAGDPGRSADWQLLASMLALRADPQAAIGAYAVALGMSNNPAGFCRSLLVQQADFGPSLKRPVEEAIRRVAYRAAPLPAECATATPAKSAP